MQVYCDTVFNPLLNRYDFYNKAWRHEFSVKDDPNSELTFKGKVNILKSGF